ncbi:MAG: universal stress protein [Polyangiaceae bacterium]
MTESTAVYRHVLVATELDHAGDVALAFGDRVARAAHAALGVVSVVTPGSLEDAASFDTRAEDRKELDHRRALVEERVHAATGRERHAFTGFIEMGDATDAIIGRAEAWGADLLIVGARPHSLLARALLGSVALSLIRSAPCDVLVAREGVEGPIIAACDLAASTSEVLETASRWSKLLGEPVVATHATELGLSDAAALATAVFSGVVPTTHSGDEQRAVKAAAVGALEASMAAASLEGRASVDAGSPADVILAAASTNKASLIVTGTRRLPAPARWVLGSVAERLAREASTSVLDARPERPR